jgi:hypothetical protein
MIQPSGTGFFSSPNWIANPVPEHPRETQSAKAATQVIAKSGVEIALKDSEPLPQSNSPARVLQQRAAICDRKSFQLSAFGQSFC